MGNTEIKEELISSGFEIPVPIFLEELEDKLDRILRENQGLSKDDIRIYGDEIEGEYGKHLVFFLHYDKK